MSVFHGCHWTILIHKDCQSFFFIFHPIQGFWRKAKSSELFGPVFACGFLIGPRLKIATVVCFFFVFLELWMNEPQIVC